MNRVQPNLTVSWSIIAFSAAMLAVASTATLAVIATINDVDSLSTIALVLAILSYGRKLWMSPWHESAAYLPP